MLKTKKTRLEWLRVGFIFSWEGLAEENGVISLNELADSLEKVTSIPRSYAPTQRRKKS